MTKEQIHLEYVRVIKERFNEILETIPVEYHVFIMMVNMDPVIKNHTASLGLGCSRCSAEYIASNVNLFEHQAPIRKETKES